MSVDGVTYEVRENGLLTKRELDLPLIPILESPTQVKNSKLNSDVWSNDSLHTVEVLMKDLSSFTPRIKKIVLKNPSHIELYPEGHGVIMLTVLTPGELARQLSTLQAFFRSSTMKDTYQELDVRFANLVVKE